MFEIIHTDITNPAIYKSKPHDLYYYTVYVGGHVFNCEDGDSAWVITKTNAEVVRGGDGVSVHSTDLAVVIRGYRCENKKSDFSTISNLPYINGCSSHQVFAPVRHGDPTAQLLYIPPNASEQAHHIHSTVRVVYVIDGEGKSIQGMNNDKEGILLPGDVLILDKMTPHHFTTGDSHLTVIPLHIYSSTVLENSHPMKNGTFIV